MPNITAKQVEEAIAALCKNQIELNQLLDIILQRFVKAPLTTCANISGLQEQYQNNSIVKGNTDKTAIIISQPKSGLLTEQITGLLEMGMFWGLNSQPQLSSLLEQLYNGKVIIAFIGPGLLPTFHDLLAIYYLASQYPEQFFILQSTLPSEGQMIQQIKDSKFAGKPNEISIVANNIIKIITHSPQLAITAEGDIYATHSNIPPIPAEGATLSDIIDPNPDATEQSLLKDRYTTLGLNHWYDVTRPVESSDTLADALTTKHIEVIYLSTLPPPPSPRDEETIPTNAPLPPPPPPPLPTQGQLTSKPKPNSLPQTLVEQPSGPKSNTKPPTSLSMLQQELPRILDQLGKGTLTSSLPKVPKDSTLGRSSKYTGKKWEDPIKKRGAPKPVTTSTQPPNEAIDRFPINREQVVAAAEAALKGSQTSRLASSKESNTTQRGDVSALAASLGRMFGVSGSIKLREKRTQRFAKFIALIDLLLSNLEQQENLNDLTEHLQSVKDTLLSLTQQLNQHVVALEKHKTLEDADAGKVFSDEVFTPELRKQVHDQLNTLADKMQASAQILDPILTQHEQRIRQLMILEDNDEISTAMLVQRLRELANRTLERNRTLGFSLSGSRSGH